MSTPGPGEAPAPGVAGAAVFDLDRTLTRWPTFVPFLLFVARRSPARGLRTLPLALVRLVLGGPRLGRTRVKEILLEAVLGGAPRGLVSERAEDFAERCVRRGLRPGARRAVAEHRAAGDYLVLATASFEFYAAPIARRLGFDAVVGTQVCWDERDRLTGRVEGENCRGPAKLRALERRVPALAERACITAYSDHQADLPLLRWSHAAVAVNPSRRLRRAADAEGFTVVDWNAGG